MHPNRPQHLVSRYLNEDQVSSGGGGGPGIAGITVSDNGAPVALPAGITTIDFLGGLVNIGDNGNPAGSTVTVEVLPQPSSISTRRLNGALNNNISVLNWDVDQGTTLSVAPAGQTNITLFDPATYVYHGTNTRANNGGVGTTTLGPSARTNGAENGTAVGRDAQAISSKSPTAVGDASRATADYTAAVGFNAQARAATASAFGANADAQNSASTAFGEQALASANNATAGGSNAIASGENSASYGVDAQATALDSCAIGLKCRATFQNACSGGASAQALATGASAYGHNPVADGVDSCAFGHSQASGDRSCTYGSAAETSDADCTAIGPSAYCGLFPELTSIGANSECNLARGTAVGASAILANDATNSCAFGHTARSDASDTVVMGVDATIFGGGIQGVCLGANSSIQLNADQCVNIGHDAACNSNTSVNIGRRASNGVAASGSVGVGTRVNIESQNNVAVGYQTTISTDSPSNVLIGDNAAIEDNVSEGAVVGSNARIIAGFGKCCVYGARAQAKQDSATIYGWGTTSNVIDGVAFGIGAAADPLGAFPGADEDLCPLALNVNASVVELTTANPGTQAGWIFIRINGSRYRIRLWENTDPGA